MSVITIETSTEQGVVTSYPLRGRALSSQQDAELEIEQAVSNLAKDIRRRVQKRPAAEREENTGSGESSSEMPTSPLGLSQ